jgi:hypothetical protein
MLLAISDVAQVSLAVGPALIAGAAGYLGARLQYRVGERGQELQRTTVRREVYARFVDSVLAEWRAWTSPALVDAKKLGKIWGEGQSRVAEDYIVGTPEVVDAAGKWTALSEQVDTRINQLAGQYISERGKTKEAFTAAVSDAYAEYEEQIQIARNELIDAMRRDVGPRARPRRRVRLVRNPPAKPRNEPAP